MERALTLSERSDSDLLRKFRRRLGQAATGLRQGLEAAAPQLDSDVQLGNYAFDPCIVSRL